MSPLPVDMRDRWASRAEPAEGKGTVYWHVLMSRYPGARAAVPSDVIVVEMSLAAAR